MPGRTYAGHLNFPAKRLWLDRTVSHVLYQVRNIHMFYTKYVTFTCFIPSTWYVTFPCLSFPSVFVALRTAVRPPTPEADEERPELPCRPVGRVRRRTPVSRDVQAAHRLDYRLHAYEGEHSKHMTKYLGCTPRSLHPRAHRVLQMPSVLCAWRDSQMCRAHWSGWWTSA